MWSVYLWWMSKDLPISFCLSVISLISISFSKLMTLVCWSGGFAGDNPFYLFLSLKCQNFKDDNKMNVHLRMIKPIGYFHITRNQNLPDAHWQWFGMARSSTNRDMVQQMSLIACRIFFPLWSVSDQQPSSSPNLRLLCSKIKEIILWRSYSWAPARDAWLWTSDHN